MLHSTISIKYVFLLKFPIPSLSGRYRENLFWRHAAASASVRPKDSSTLTPHFVSNIPPVMRGWNRYPGNFLNCIHSGPVGDRGIPACFAICILILVLYHRLHYRGLQWEMRYKYGEKLLRRAWVSRYCRYFMEHLQDGYYDK